MRRARLLLACAAALLAALPLGAHAACPPCAPGTRCSASSCAACAPGFFCPGGTPAPAVPCLAAANCAAAGLSAEPPCVWSASTLAGSGNTSFSNGQGTAAAFARPAGVLVIDAVGLVYVCDSDNSRVRAVSLSGAVSALAGSGALAFADGVGVAASFNRPRGIAAPPGASVIYVTDPWNNRIRSVTPTGVVATFAGSGSAAWADGQGTSASFSWPISISVDPAGLIYVADTGSSRIRKITPSGLVTTLAGTGVASFSNGVGTSSAAFNVPRGVAADGSGSVFVGDAVNNRIRRIFPNGTVVTFAGSGAPLWADGSGTLAAFSYPTYLALAANGNLLVCDSTNNRVRMVTPAGAVTTLAGDGASSFLDGYGTASRFSAPSGVAVGASGTLYIGDFSNNRLRALACVPYPPCPASYFCVAGVPALCPAGFFCPPLSSTPTPCTAAPGSGCAAGSAANATLCAPGFFCPGGTPAPAVPCLSAANCAAAGLSAEPPCVWNASTLAGSDSLAFLNGQGTAAAFNRPAGVLVIDAVGLVYVCDSDNSRIRAVSLSGAVSALAGSGAFALADGVGVAASFNRPRGIAAPPDASVIYVADASNNCIRSVTRTGVVTTFAGSGSTGAADGQGTSASFTWPTAIAVDAAGILYVADTGSHLVRKIFPTGIVYTLAGTGLASFSNGVGTSTAAFNTPRGVAVDGSGSVFVSDAVNNRIRIIFPNGTVATFAGSGAAAWADGAGALAAFSFPTYLALAANGNLIVTDNGSNRVRMITPAGAVTTLAGDGTGSFLDGYGTSSRFYNPMGVAVASSGTLYIGDFSNSRLRALACVPYPPCPASYYCVAGVPVLCPAGFFCPPLSSTPTPCTAAPGSGCAAGSAANATLCAPGFFCPGGMPAPAVPCLNAANCAAAGLSAEPPAAPCVWNASTLAGSDSMAFSNGQGTAAAFSRPAGVLVIDAVGLVYVCDSENSRVRAVSLSGAVSTLAGSGALAFADGAGAAASFNRPRGIAASFDGSIIYVADAFNHRIRSVTRTGVVTTFAGSGSAAWTDGQGASASFNRPNAVAVDSAGFVYVADAGNHRIRKISPLNGLTMTLAGTGVASFSNGVGTSSAAFNTPRGVAVDGSGGIIYVADAFNHRLRRIFPNGTVDTFAGSGAAAWADGVGVQAAMSQPMFLAFAANGNLVFTDHMGNRTRMVTPAGVVTTLAGDGAGSHLDGFGTASRFNLPMGISVASSGVLLVGDSGSHRIRVLACVPCPSSFYCPAGTPLPCPPGAYCPLSATAPLPCAAGTNSSAPGASVCGQCPPGTFSNASGALQCSACPAGTVSAPGSAGCAPATPSPTVTPSATASGTQTPSPSPTPPPTPPATPSATASGTQTPSQSASESAAATPPLTPLPTPPATPSVTPSPTASPTPTGTGSGSPSPRTTPSPSPPSTPPASASGSGAGAPSAGASPSGGSVPAASATASGSGEPPSAPSSPSLSGSSAAPPSTPTPTPSASCTASSSAAASLALGASASSSGSQSPSSSASSTRTPSGTPTATPTGSAASTPSSTPSGSSALSANATASFALGASASDSASDSATPPPAASPTGTGSATASGTGTAAATPTSTESASSTVSSSATASLTLGASASSSGSQSLSSSATSTRTLSPTGTGIPTATPTGSGSATASGTGTAAPTPAIAESASSRVSSLTAGASASAAGSLSQSASVSAAPTPTPTPTGSPTGSSTGSPAPTPSSTLSGSSTLSQSASATLSRGASPSATASVPLSPSPTPPPTASPTATATPSASGTATGTLTPSPSLSASGTVSATATASLTRGASPSNTASVSLSGSATPSATQSGTPTASPSATPTPTPRPTPTSTLSASTTASGSPTPSLTVGASPSATPSGSPSAPGTPSATPSASPSASPTSTLTPTPSLSAGASPSVSPSGTLSPTATGTRAASFATGVGSASPPLSLALSASPPGAAPSGAPATTAPPSAGASPLGPATATLSLPASPAGSPSVAASAAAPQSGGAGTPTAAPATAAPPRPPTAALGSAAAAATTSGSGAASIVPGGDAYFFAGLGGAALLAGLVLALKLLLARRPPAAAAARLLRLDRKGLRRARGAGGGAQPFELTNPLRTARKR